MNSAPRARLAGRISQMASQKLRSHDPRWHCDNSVACQNIYRSEHFTDRGNCHHIPVTDRRNGNDRVINTNWNIGKVRSLYPRFHQIHKSSCENREKKDSEEKDENFGLTLNQAPHDGLPTPNMAYHF